jgi:hypothetical protein
MVRSSDVQILLYMRQSSADSRVVDLNNDGKSLIKSRNNRGPRTVPWGTPDETVLAGDVWPSSTTCWLRSKRKLAIQSCRCPPDVEVMQLHI